MVNRSIFVLFAALLFCATTATAQSVASKYVPLDGTCAFFDSHSLSTDPIAAETVVSVAVRGICGVPSQAVAVTIFAEVTSKKEEGGLYIFDNSISAGPDSIFMVFRGEEEKQAVGFGTVRLCPLVWCVGFALGIEPTTDAHVRLRVAGYYKP